MLFGAEMGRLESALAFRLLVPILSPTVVVVVITTTIFHHHHGLATAVAPTHPRRQSLVLDRKLEVFVSVLPRVAEGAGACRGITAPRSLYLSCLSLSISLAPSSSRPFALSHIPRPRPHEPQPPVSSEQPPPQGNRLLVMATTAIPYLLEDLMLVQAFMVSLHVPQLQGGDSVKTVLKELVPMSQVSNGGMTSVRRARRSRTADSSDWFSGGMYDTRVLFHAKNRVAFFFSAPQVDSDVDDDVDGVMYARPKVLPLCFWSEVVYMT